MHLYLLIDEMTFKSAETAGVCFLWTWKMPHLSQAAYSYVTNGLQCMVILESPCQGDKTRNWILGESYLYFLSLSSNLPTPFSLPFPKPSSPHHLSEEFSFY